MITPAEILRKAIRIYPQAVEAWLMGDDSFFPRRVPAKLQFPKDAPQSTVIHQVTELRENSKSQIGYGYTVHYEQINRRSHGDNLYPSAIVIDSLDDLLRLIRKQRECQLLMTAIGKLRARLPALESWYSSNWKRLLPICEHLEDLILIVEFLRDHPQPGCYLREIPLPVSTKLIEQNKALLGDWLDRTLVPEAINFGCDRRDFEQRYGFNFVRRHILLRLLDPTLQAELGFPSDELSMPATAIATLKASQLKVFVVENKINLLTLPPMPRSIALGGLGNNLAEFAMIPWLADQEIFYWGDLDIDGLLILSRFRRMFPNAQGLLMDLETLLAHQALWTQRIAESNTLEPNELHAGEMEAFRYCREHAIRLEQEHIPQTYVNQALRR